MKRRVRLSAVLLLSVATLLLLPAPLAGGSPRNNSGGNSSDPLAITGVAPNSGPAAGGTTVTIVGTGFKSSASVTFGGVVAAAVTYVSSIELQATTPAHAAGTVEIAVTQNPHNQSAALANAYTYTDTLTVTGVSPASGPTAGGTTVAITGTGFQAGATVAFGSMAAATVTLVSSTRIDAVTPASTAGTVSITVSNPDSRSATLANTFIYTDSLAITGVSPAQGPVTGGTTVAITGTGFQAGATVVFGSVAATTVTVVSSSRIDAVTPASTAGTVSITVTNPDSQSRTLADAFTYVEPLSIAGVSPTEGPTNGGTSVTISGTGFHVGATVVFGSMAATTVTVVSSSRIDAVTPASTAGTVSITVSNPDSQSATLANAFTYMDSLAITGVSPAQGPTAGGTTVTITGINFRTSASVTFGGVLAPTVTYISSTELQAITPAHAAGTVEVVVNQNPRKQTATMANAFRYVDSLTVAGISPTSGPTAGGTTVTITGGGFESGAGVTFGGVAATSVSFISSAEITATTPSAAAGTVGVTVTNPDSQTATLPSAFTYVDSVSITGVSPTEGPTSGGTTVTITGTGFQSGATVTFGSAAATSVTVVSSTQISAVTPAESAGSVGITVTNPDSQSATLAAAFTYVSQPSISSVSPTSGTTSGGTTVTITGTGFQAGATVAFGSLAATSVSFVSSSELQAVTPASTAGAVSVVVTNPDSQTATLANAFTYVESLSITGVSPTSGPTSGGTVITLTGTGFQTGATVSFGSVAATSVTVVSSTQISAVTPAESAGSVGITVTNPDSQTATLANAFSFIDSLSISGVSPSKGPVSGGTVVTITGTGFQTGATVAFGSVAATSVTFVSSSELQAVTPASTAGAVSVVVTNPDSQTATLPNAFTYVESLSITGVSPAQGPTAGGTAVTITGTGFQAGATVSFGSVAATSVTVVSSTQMSATSPAESAGAVSIVVTNPDSQTATLANAYTYIEPLSITGVSPTEGLTSGGTVVTITGTGFQAGATVTFGAVQATSVNAVSSTQIDATSPPQNSGTVSITVTNPDSQSAMLANAFTYTAAPMVSSVSPTSGSATGGTTVTIAGSGFASGATVTFGGVGATSVTFVSSSELQAVTPASAAGTVSIVVTNPDSQTATLANAFTYVVPPTVSGVSPTSGPVTGGTTVTITGSGFVSGAAVTFGGTAATSVTFVSSSELQAVTPAESAGWVGITVTNPDSQSATLANAYTYTDSLTVTGVSPTSGPMSGGTAVTITGTDFQAGATVSFGSVAATSVTVVSSAQISAVTPAESAGTVSITVTNPDSQSATLASAFTYVDSLSITGVSPTEGPTSGGTVVTITGTGFQMGATVMFGSVAATSVTFVSSSELQAVTPAESAGSVGITVTNPDSQTATLANAFSFIDSLSISGVSPSKGPVSGGTVVTITGTGFQTGATVAFGSVPATSVTIVSSTQMSATSPSESAGTVGITVTNPDSQSATLAAAFTYVSQPSISSVSPTSGSTSGGTAVTITGTDFQAGATVSFGSVAATSVTVVNSAQISAVTPAESAGTVSITVTNPDSQSATLASAFTYIEPLSLTGVSPAQGPTSGGTVVTITGTGFQMGATVMFGSVAATSVTFVSSSELQAVTPAESAGTVGITVTNPDSQSATLANAFTYADSLAITGVLPAEGPVTGGTIVTITGSGFVSGAAVTFGGVAATSVSFISSSEITATTPSSGAGTVSITVTNPDSQSATLANAYTYMEPLSITGVSPTEGPTSGGTVVTITGTGFQAGATVTFGGVGATSVTFVSSSELQAETPASMAGTLTVAVTNPDSQSATLVNGYTYTDSLTVAGISPTSGPTAGGTTVTITGTGFQTGATVVFGGVAATSVTFVSSSELQAVTPAESAGTVGITVTNPDSQAATLANAFTYADSLAITGVLPAEGPVTGGTIVTITGTSFRSSASVTFDGVAAAAVTYVSSTELQVTTPAHVAGPVDIVVSQRRPRESVTLTGGFTYTDLLTLTDVSPAEGPVIGGTVVTLSGTSFKPGATVAFGSEQSTAVAVLSSVQINAMLPPASAGTVDVTVTNPNDESVTLSSAFTYTTAPLIYSIWPISGPVTGGTPITIMGGGFASGARVSFGGVAAASVTFVSSNELQAVTPASTAGTVSIVVTNPDSETGTLEAGFAFFHTVTLSWTASTSDVKGYNVYRSSTSGGPYIRLNIPVITGTTFTDNNVQAGETLFYVATSDSVDNVEGDYSNEAQVTVPFP